MRKISPFLKFLICIAFIFIISAMFFSQNILFSAEIIKQSPNKIVLGSVFYVIIEFENDFIAISSVSNDLIIRNYKITNGKNTNKIKLHLQILDEKEVSLNDLKLTTTGGSFTFENYFVDIIPLQVNLYTPVSTYSILEIFTLKVFILVLMVAIGFILILFMKKPMEQIFSTINTNIKVFKLYNEIMNTIKRIDYNNQPKEKAYLFSEIIETMSKNVTLWNKDNSILFYNYLTTIHNLKYRAIQDFSSDEITSVLNLFDSLRSEIVQKLSCIPERHTLFIKLFYK